jgi:nonribosomal peptide synthetase protein BlmIV
VGLTPSGLLCAAFATVLGSYCESPRFTLNLTTFNRIPVHPHVDTLVGDFTTTTLLAVDVAGASFVDNARRMQEQMWRDLDHRLVSGVEVQRMLRRRPGRLADAMMPVVFTSTLWEDSAAAPPSTGAWRAVPGYSISQTPQVLLDHQVGEDADGLACSWDYVEGAFPAGLVETMFTGYQAILAALAARARPADNDSGGVLG